MFGGALRLGPESLRQIRRRQALFLRTLGAIWIGVPLLNLLVVLALDVTGLAATILLLMAICPGMPLLVASTRSVEGAMGTAFAALFLIAVMEPLLIPQWTRLLSLLSPADLTVQTKHVLAVLVPTVFLPVALGFGVRMLAPRSALDLARVCEMVAIVGIAMDVIVVLIQGAPLLVHVPLRAFAAAVLVTLGDATIGYWVGWPNREDQKAIAMASSLGNPALALAIVEVSSQDPKPAHWSRSTCWSGPLCCFRSSGG
jgi:predicted Na+-dependent transporter